MKKVKAFEYWLNYGSKRLRSATKKARDIVVVSVTEQKGAGDRCAAIVTLPLYLEMPKKRTARDQARYYTLSQRSRLPLPPQDDQPIKDVTTQLHELRIEQAREQQLHKQKMTSTSDSLPVTSSLGFIPADYTTNPCVGESRPTTARRIPGPAPPKSWTETPRKRILRRTSVPDLLRSRTVPRAPFDGLEFPRLRSLTHQSLISLATYFYEHQEFNKYYLPTLNLLLKQQLLSYIAAKNIAGAITKEGLDVLFPYSPKKDDPEEMTEIIRSSRKDEQYLQCLDLSDSLGRTLTLHQLRSFLQTTHPNPSSVWDIPEPRFPNLTHLSLDAAPVHVPKVDLLKLAHTLSESCTRLTHLSVAGIFPVATVTCSTVTSASALVYLSKHLVCLEYVDLSRTPLLEETYGWDHSRWQDDTQVSDTPNKGWRVLERLDWSGAWRLVRTVVVKKCGSLTESEVRSVILKRRGGKGWVHVIT